MRNYANDEPDLGIGGVKTAMREAAGEIDKLRATLKNIANQKTTEELIAEGGIYVRNHLNNPL